LHVRVSDGIDCKCLRANWLSTLILLHDIVQLQKVLARGDSERWGVGETRLKWGVNVWRGMRWDNIYLTSLFLADQ